jgi:tetratricopeptide (TPR) repeat protein
MAPNLVMGAMAQMQCCPAMDLQWTQRVVDNQYADVYFCASCGHVHRTEKYMVSMRLPYQDRCVNCGGELRGDGGDNAYQTPDTARVRCSQCGLSANEDRALHDRLASILPDGGYLRTSEALVESGRNVLALKLATAETRWGSQPVEGEVQRLAILEVMNEYDRALDEAYEWAANEGCPTLVWGVIAQLEAGSGNIAGALTALERGINLEPENSDWWIDYAELNLHLDDRPNAVRGAAKALHDVRSERRGVEVIAEVGERYYASGMYAEALSSCSVAAERQEQYFELAWLRARIAAINQDTQYLVQWLETAVRLDPNHTEAQEMLAPYKRKRGWFSW